MSGKKTEDIIFQTPGSQASKWEDGQYLCACLSGNFTSGLAESVRKEVLEHSGSIAIDASQLSGTPMGFAREIYFAARNRRTGEHRLVLIQPSDQLRSLLRLISDSHDIPFLGGFDQLPEDPKEIEERLRQIEGEKKGIRENLGRHPIWRYTDRDNFWICPYCAKPIGNVRIVSRVSVPEQAVEAVYNHLRHKCPRWDPSSPSMFTPEEMAEEVTKINRMKMEGSREHAQQLQSRVSELEKTKEWADEMEQGLKVAVERQKKLLPERAPTVEGFDISLVYRPAAEVSGDLYDFIEMEDGRIAFFLGDVSGHGIEAAILMGMTKKVLQIRVSEIPDLGSAVLQANVDICREMDGKSFVTAFVAILDPKSKVLTYVRAGHNPPFIVNPGREEPEPVDLDANGTILGMNSGPLFERVTQLAQFQLQSGDHILLYTDGIEEAKNFSDEEFGRERMIEVIRREYGKPLPYQLSTLSYELDQFAAGVPLEDDVTIIGIRVL